LNKLPITAVQIHSYYIDISLSTTATFRICLTVLN